LPSTDPREVRMRTFLRSFRPRSYRAATIR
jgi:hypothetical protein